MNSTSNWVPPAPGAEPDEDPRVVRAAQEYLHALESGSRPDRTDFAVRHADIFPALAPYLDAMDLLHKATPLPPVVEAPLEPAAVGDFRIVREIGRGGMGVVYEAIQLSLGRRVALKVLPFAATLDAKQLQRFKNEAQAAAQLHHTNIVPVYGVGCERGVHFYAMQLIEGQNLCDLIADLRRLKRGRGELAGEGGTQTRGTEASSAAGGPQPAAAFPTIHSLATEMTTRRVSRPASFYQTAARLAAQVAEALEHAHQLGVIHRDVKPANLLIDARGCIWVTDFGLAQFHTGVGLTRTGDLMGTLRYMSPEQAGGQRIMIDARTDVYSLGATLYELLTLEPLFDGADHGLLLSQILHNEPRPPRQVDRNLPTELETIVLKAVSKNPADRYATAQEFADDLHRFLENLPIRARRPTPTQRVKKWAQRHPAFVAATLVVLALLSVASLVTAAVIHGEQAKAEARANVAEARFRLAQRSVDELFQLSEDELAGRPGTERMRKRILESVLAYYRELIDQRRGEPEAQADLQKTEKEVEKIVADLTLIQSNGQLELLTQPDVLDDLALDEDQRVDVKKLTDRLAAQRDEWLKTFRNPIHSDEVRDTYLRQARENDEKVKFMLSPAQRERLPQIALQQQGPSAFRESDVAAALKLNSRQRTRIRQIDEEAFFKDMRDWKQSSTSPEEMRKAKEERTKTASKTIFEEVLNQEQKQKWSEMTGAAFKGKTPFYPPFFMGPPPPGGPPPGGVIRAVPAGGPRPPREPGP